MRAKIISEVVPFDFVNTTVLSFRERGRVYVTVDELMKEMTLDLNEVSNKIAVGQHLNRLGGIHNQVKVSGWPVTIWKISAVAEPFCNKTARAELNLHTLNTVPPTGGAL